MRRKHLAIALGLPLANALSLQNFQQITSLLIPISCQLAYDEQIPSCTVDDFTNGCSKSCKKGLKSVASDVSDGCSSIIVSSNTLLGIVMNGGIIEALCPTGTQTTQTTAAPSATPDPVNTPDPAPAVSVTLPTASPGVTGGGGVKSSTATLASTTLTASRVSTSTKSRSTLTTADETSTSATPSSTSSASEDATTTSASQKITTSLERASPVTSSSKTTSATSNPKANSQDTGGGSPFDISSNARRIEGSSIFGAVVAIVWACVLLGR